MSAPQNPQEEQLNDLFGVVYDQLRSLAHRLRQPNGDVGVPHATSIVHESYLRLANLGPERRWRRRHLLGVAAKAMRSVLVDAVRARAAAKRGGGLDRVPLNESALSDTTLTDGERSASILALDEALERLATLDARKAQIVELRFFGGLSVEETADVLELSPTTVKREWRFAKSWLLKEISPEG